MKYIVAEVSLAGCKQKLPFIFPSTIVHKEMSLFVVRVLRRHGFDEVDVVSAGEVHFGKDRSLEPVVHCGGKSETLGLISKEGDGQMIQLHDYLHGLS